jgi:hypothetical protein
MRATLLSYTDSVMWSWRFGYDQLNQLVPAANSGGATPVTELGPKLLLGLRQLRQPAPAEHIGRGGHGPGSIRWSGYSGKPGTRTSRRGQFGIAWVHFVLTISKQFFRMVDQLAIKLNAG